MYYSGDGGGGWIRPKILGAKQLLGQYICVGVTSIKGSVIVISSDPPYKDGKAQFTTAPLKTLSNQV